MTDHEERYRRLIADLDQLVCRYLADGQAAGMSPADTLASAVTALSDAIGSVIAGAMAAGALQDWEDPVMDGLRQIVAHKLAASRATAATGNQGAVH